MQECQIIYTDGTHDTLTRILDTASFTLGDLGILRIIYEYAEDLQTPTKFDDINLTQVKRISFNQAT